ncbi:MAG: ABC transporter permease [Nitriliruptoraceae bacterium]
MTADTTLITTSLDTDRRRTALVQLTVAAIAITLTLVAASVLAPIADITDLSARRQPPSWQHPFGTDRLGRDMLARTVVGLRLSLGIGALAALISAAIALVLGSVAGVVGRWVDAAVSWLVDLFLSLPHLVLLILIAVAVGRGIRGVLIAVALTHWPTLTRVLRAEARRVTASEYVTVARRLGRSETSIATGHLSRHLGPHLMVGTILLFPHAILHEAALSFLGLGLPPHAPAIGILLADAMRELSAGSWWLALLPGLALLLVVKAVDAIGQQIRALTDPWSVHA